MKLYKLLPTLSLEVLYKLGLPVQAFTIYHLISLFFLPILIFSKKIKISFILLLIIIFYSYTLIVTLIQVQLYTINVGNVDIYPIFRQIGGLTLGLITFIILRFSFEANPKKALKFLLYSVYIILLFVLIFDIGLHKNFVRLYGTFTEPSHLGQCLVFILLPTALLVNDISRKNKYIILSIVLLLIFLTFSLSTYIRFSLFLIFLTLLGNLRQKFKYFIYTSLIVSLIIIVFSTVFKNSYVVYQFSLNFFAFKNLDITAYATASLIDRIQLIYIIKNISNLGLNSLWGIGAGFEQYYLQLLYPPEILNTILSVKQVPSYINSFWGKVLIYYGIIGSIMLVLILIKTLKISAKILNYREKKILQAALLSIYTYAFFGLAPLQSIELWFWIAFIDGYYLYIYKRKVYYG